MFEFDFTGVIMKIIVLDCDYLFNVKGEPVIRIYGKKTEGSGEGNNVVLHVKGFEPYFYAEGVDEVDIINIASEYIKRIENVEKYSPVGYQIEKVAMKKIILYNPRNTPIVRKKIEEIGGVCYEADILFRNRFMIDRGIIGTGVIEFDHIGKELNNYGISCIELYICNVEDIRTLDEIVKIEY